MISEYDFPKRKNTTKETLNQNKYIMLYWRDNFSNRNKVTIKLKTERKISMIKINNFFILSGKLNTKSIILQIFSLKILMT